MMTPSPVSEQIRRSDPQRATVKVAAVAIGRNEGERLRLCLTSLSRTRPLVYVDSGSSDGSPQLARTLGADVVELDMSAPFSAARARNAGFRRLLEREPDVDYVQFVDGDCELNADWLEHATSYLNTHADVGAVCGRRRERFPDKTVYNWLCDLEWARPPGEDRAFGGDVLLRSDVLSAVGGYRDDVIAAEDDEVSIRLRAAGWRIWRLPDEMTLHDAAMTRFGQWWRRAVRCGYAFALGAYLHGAGPERHFVWESRRAQIWGLWLPVACAAFSLVFWPWGLCAWLIYPMQMLRQTIRNSGPLTDRLTLAFFQVLGRFAEAAGQLKFFLGRLFGREAHLIEYK